MLAILTLTGAGTTGSVESWLVWTAMSRSRILLPMLERVEQMQYAINTWNQYQSALDEGDMTNNSSEGWNNLFNRIVGAAHPTIWASSQSSELFLSGLSGRNVCHDFPGVGVERERLCDTVVTAEFFSGLGFGDATLVGVETNLG
ncbi:hypothetical protein B566_EDAN012429 [Ephemera danica]|nr:hypothetical protein B566_EDAN012429 [Ephemera danica]